MQQETNKIFGLIGYPVKHSLSALMHNAAFKELGIDAKYELFEVSPQELKKFLLKDVFEKNISGFNITIPHKVRAQEILENEFPSPKEGPIHPNLHYARLTGAVNTVKNVSGELKYFNTDASGFLDSIKEDLGYSVSKDTTALVLGCGGASRAVVAALGWDRSGVKKIYLSDIRQEAMEAMKKHFVGLGESYLYLTDKLFFVDSKEVSRKLVEECDLLVNTSPVGMESDDQVINSEFLHKKLYVYDVIYNRETRLIKEALSLGLSASNGLGMLLYQGVAAFELWTEREAPVEVMRRALEEGVKKL